MAPKKKQPHNAFFYFMAEFDRDYRKSGRPFPGGLKAISEKVSPLWQAMSSEDRKPYEEQASSQRGAQKLTTHGQTYEQVDQERRAIEQKQERMFATIRRSVAKLNRRDLPEETFFLVHMNYLCKTGDGTYYPAEVALAAFSIKNGVQEPYFTLVNPGPLPTGYAYKAVQHAEDTHRIDASRGLGERDIFTIVSAIEQYVDEWQTSGCEAGKLPPFYTLEKFVPSIEFMLTRWAKVYDKPPDFFRVYVLEELFFELKTASLKPIDEREMIDGKLDEGFVYSSVAGKKLGDDPYSYKPKIACDLHEELDAVQHCSRSYVIRWGWLMCDYLCPDLGVVRIPGKHCPYDTAVLCKTYQPASRAPPPLLSYGRGAQPLQAPPLQAASPPTVGVSRGAVPRTGVRRQVPEWEAGPSGDQRRAAGRSSWRPTGGDQAGGPAWSHQAGGPAWSHQAGGPAAGPAWSHQAGGPASGPAWGNQGANQAEPPPDPNQFDDADFFPALNARRRRHQGRQPSDQPEPRNTGARSRHGNNPASYPGGDP